MTWSCVICKHIKCKGQVDRVHQIHPKTEVHDLFSNHTSSTVQKTHRYSQDVRELVCFSLSEAIPRICDKNKWHHKLSLRVHQLLKCLFCCRDWHPSPDKYAINVKQQPKAWLWLQQGMNKKKLVSQPNRKGDSWRAHSSDSTHRNKQTWIKADVWFKTCAMWSKLGCEITNR